ncbi:MAG TPA: 5-carboxymethyl-2-hydroxymuconate Delta-isomerase [Rhodocyclaceae bacterium]|nr:5-carboxymethyl-2-hydroxymuconate Delta-isomerase [Rhodocyclaceae bacterium]
MPHLTIEYTSNIQGFNASETLAAMNAILIASGECEEVDVKSRTLRLDDFQIGGNAATARGFVHGELALLSGRSAETKKRLSDELMRGLQKLAEHWSKDLHIQLSVEIRDMDRASYGKAAIGA